MSRVRVEFSDIVGWALVVFGCLFLVANSIILFSGAFKFGHDKLHKWVLGAAASIVPWVIAALPLAMTETWHNSRIWSWHFRRPTFMSAAVVFVWLIFIGYNLAGGAGVIATSRLETVADRDKATETTQALRDQRARLQARLKGIPEHRPSAAVEKLIAAEKNNRRWSTSSQCADATAKASREFCDGVRRLEGEMENARAADRLNVQITALDGQIASAAPTIASSDPQADLLHDATGWSKATIQLWLPAMTPIVLEIGAATCWHFGFLVLGISLRRKAAPAPQSASVAAIFNPAPLMSPEKAKAIHVPTTTLTRQRQLCEWFWRECSRPVAAGVMSEREWYEHYEAVCRRSNDQPLPLESFRRIAGRFIPRIGDVNGETHYFEVLPLIAEGAA